MRKINYINVHSKPICYEYDYPVSLGNKKPKCPKCSKATLYLMYRTKKGFTIIGFICSFCKQLYLIRNYQIFKIKNSGNQAIYHKNNQTLLGSEKN